ncbi:hypothetical protein AB0F18_33115 [Streptomyces sp. NPDC029216]|uniref:hypothetical protein n=1 Tax=Streptomyces sp. NPDC029216 TaxID=3154701 RepID=UPI0033FC7CB0
MKTNETITWAAVGILLVLALVAPLFGDSPSGVVIPLLLAMTFAGAALTLRKKAATG